MSTDLIEVVTVKNIRLCLVARIGKGLDGKIPARWALEERERPFCWSEVKSEIEKCPLCIFSQKE